MRITKADLERQLETSSKHITQLRDEIVQLRAENTFLKQYSSGAHVCSLVIATERISDALAHTLRYKLQEDGKNIK